MGAVVVAELASPGAGWITEGIRSGADAASRGALGWWAFAFAATIAAHMAGGELRRLRIERTGEDGSVRFMKIQRHARETTQQQIETEREAIRNELVRLGCKTRQEHLCIYDRTTGESIWRSDKEEASVRITHAFAKEMKEGRRQWEIWHNHPGNDGDAVMSRVDLLTMGVEGVIAEGVVNDDGEWTLIELDEEWTRGRSDSQIEDEMRAWASEAVDAADKVAEWVLENEQRDDGLGCGDALGNRQGRPRWSILYDVRQRSAEGLGMTKVTTSFGTGRDERERVLFEWLEREFQTEFQARMKELADVEVHRGRGAPDGRDHRPAMAQRAPADHQCDQGRDGPREVEGVDHGDRHLGGGGKPVAAQDEGTPGWQTEPSAGRSQERPEQTGTREMRTRPTLPSRRKQAEQRMKGRARAGLGRIGKEPAKATSDPTREPSAPSPGRRRPTSAELASRHDRAMRRGIGPASGRER